LPQGPSPAPHEPTGCLGNVKRTTAEKDRRVHLLAPTAAGEAMLEEFRKTRRAMIGEHFAHWTEDERRIFLSLLRRAFGKWTAGSRGKGAG
jgi:DNA-binding MarR family transcriptional regulator